MPIYTNGYIGIYSNDVELAYNSSIGFNAWRKDEDVLEQASNWIESSTTIFIPFKFKLINYTGMADVFKVPMPKTPEPVTSFNTIVNVNPIYLQTMDKTNQPMHPSVIYIPTGIYGYKYWMVETPLPYGTGVYQDRWECPHIHCSKDGVEWETPNGLINPIDDLTTEEISSGDYFSDPHLVYKNGVLECYYRITRFEEVPNYPGFAYPTWLLRKTSADGVTWTEREVIANLQELANTLYDMVRSPSIIWDGTKYKMWFINKLPNIKPRNLVYAESADGVTWTGRKKLHINRFYR